MSTMNVRVVGHFVNSSGKTLTHFGSGIPFLLSGVNAITDGIERPDPAAIATKIASKTPSGATFVVTGYAILDRETNPPGML